MTSFGDMQSDDRAYRCAVLSCGVERRGRKPRDAGFISADCPELGFAPAGKRHFCSARCAEVWFGMQSMGPAARERAELEFRAARARIDESPPPVRTLRDLVRDGAVPADAIDEEPDVPPLYPDGDAPGRVTSARDWTPRRSSVSE